MRRCEFHDRLEIKDGKLVRIVNATARSKKLNGRSLDVLKEFLDGTKLVRNLYYAPIGGYFVCFPGEMESYGYSISLQRWAKPCINIHNISWYTRATEKDISNVVSLYPDFKYVIQKCPWLDSVEQIFEAVKIWKDHKEMEFILQLKFRNLAFNRNLYRLSNEKKKSVMQWVRQNPNGTRYCLYEIQRMIADGISSEDYSHLETFNHLHGFYATWDEYLFLKDKDSKYQRLYFDYKKMAKKAGHDMKQNYWKYPSNLEQFHAKVLRECKKIDAMTEAEKQMVKQKLYSKAVKKMANKVLDYGKLRVYIPTEISDIINQADKLHQCLITCDYIKRVIDKKCILVFVKEGKKPVATAELLPNKKIGQFYGNELDRKNCLPPTTAKRAVNKWLREVA